MKTLQSGYGEDAAVVGGGGGHGSCDSCCLPGKSENPTTE